jgi:hypothetical protein
MPWMMLWKKSGLQNKKKTSLTRYKCMRVEIQVYISVYVEICIYMDDAIEEEGSSEQEENIVYQVYSVCINM